MYRCIDQERDYQNNPKAFARDVLRFEIALEGTMFLRRLEYAPRDAALTDSSVPTPIAAAHPPAVTTTPPVVTSTPPAVTAASTPTRHLEEQNQQHKQPPLLAAASAN